MALARFAVYVAPNRGRPGHPLGRREPDDGPLRWRMLAANNRDVARSADSFPDIASCVEAIERVQRMAGEALFVTARVGRADWSWRLRLDGEEVAASSRTYQRRLQCEAACALFAELVRDATLVEIPAQSHVTEGGEHPIAESVVGPEYGTRRG